jgi:hypothetical protein
LTLFTILNTDLSYFRVSRKFFNFYRFAIRLGGGRTTVDRVHKGVDQPGFGFGVGPKSKIVLRSKARGLPGWGELRCSDLGTASPDVGCWRCVAGRGLPEVRCLAFFRVVKGGELVDLCQQRRKRWRPFGAAGMRRPVSSSELLLWNASSACGEATFGGCQHDEVNRFHLKTRSNVGRGAWGVRYLRLT